ncbi:RNA demethylase ALKBH10B isoform X2 [Raphanus sativus]|uniref:RNA demethylase ALKBH10B isoform X2 n=1 Tax=Raphanus sativus TaxID=3726 RepID=A0A9W3DIS7_RAPSA|nr:RNA demethylase ALKBH10B isoform X2 [Raphanus sativus]
MAMPPGNVAPPPPSDKLQFPPPAVAAGSWIPDERDVYISWMRGEFAAANAIIDRLCHHLQAIGDQNQYEAAISAIRNRQSNWSQAIYMQPYYTIGDVHSALQHAAWGWKLKTPQQQQQPQRHYNGAADQTVKFGGKRSGYGFNKHHHGGGGNRGAESMARNGGNQLNSDSHNNVEAKLASDVKGLSIDEEEKRDGSEKPKGDRKDLEEPESTGGAETQAEIVNHDYQNNLSCSEVKQDEKDKECTASMAKTFVVEEMYEAKVVNVVEGLKLYENMVEANEVSQLVSIVNNLKTAGRRGQLQIEAYVGYKRPNRGHGREMIQLGLPIADFMPDDESFKGRRIEPIPSFLSDIIERLVTKQIIPVKPDACIIDFFNEGDHSQPHMLAPWFGRPVGILSLSECDFTFGRVIVSDHPGDYKGSLKLSLTPGSVLLVEGKSADLAKFAIHSIPKQRILITFTKSQSRNSLTGPNWAPPPSRSPPTQQHNRHPHKHYHPVNPTTGVFPPNGAVQPIFISPSPPLPPQMPFPGGVIPRATTVWPHPQHQPPPQPRLPIPGTGVFLPPGSAQERVLQSSTEKFNGSNAAVGKLEIKTKEESVSRVAAEEEGDGNSGSGDGKQSN